MLLSDIFHRVRSWVEVLGEVDLMGEEGGLGRGR